MEKYESSRRDFVFKALAGCVAAGGLSKLVPLPVFKVSITTFFPKAMTHEEYLLEEQVWSDSKGSADIAREFQASGDLLHQSVEFSETEIVWTMFFASRESYERFCQRMWPTEKSKTFNEDEFMNRGFRFVVDSKPVLWAFFSENENVNVLST